MRHLFTYATLIALLAACGGGTVGPDADSSAATAGVTAASHVQTNARNVAAGTNALSFGSNTTAGNLLIAEVDWTGGSSFASISDRQGNVWSQIGTEQASSAIGVRSRLYYARNIKGGADTVTTAVSGTPAYHELYIHEYSGLSISAPLDGFSVRSGTGSSSFTSNTVTTTASNDLLYGIEIDSSVGSAASGWATRSSLDSNVAADKIASTAGAYAFTGTSSGSSLAWIAAFKVGGSSGGNDTIPPSIPTNLTATAVSASQINLAWSASTDNVAVTGYKVFRGGVQVAASATSSYSDGGLAPSTTYAYTISAYDAAGNNSAQSSSALATTQSSGSSGGSYSTSFANTENPISEGGRWINGQVTGVDWGDVASIPGLGYGPSLKSQYADPTAVLTGTWASDQQAEGTVKVNTPLSGSHEVELRLRTTIAPHSIKGYEILCNTGVSSNYGIQIVRWNGPLNDFTGLAGGPALSCVNGDVLKATAIGNTITVYLNGAKVLQATDSTYTGGSPGIGFYDNQDGNWTSFGFSTFRATGGTPGGDTTPPTVPTSLSASAISSSRIDLGRKHGQRRRHRLQDLQKWCADWHLCHQRLLRHWSFAVDRLLVHRLRIRCRGQQQRAVKQRIRDDAARLGEHPHARQQHRLHDGQQRRCQSPRGQQRNTLTDGDHPKPFLLRHPSRRQPASGHLRRYRA
jgi:hypothetical protein